MALDDMRLRALLEQSHDLHTDAMETTRVALDEYVELAHDDPWQDVDPVTRRTALLGGLPKSGVLAAAGLGTAMVALLARPAFADKTMDVQMLQTAASIENLAVATYNTALTLDFICSSSNRSSAGNCSCDSCNPSVPSRLVAKTIASPATALEISLTSSVASEPRLLPWSRSLRLPR